MCEYLVKRACYPEYRAVVLTCSASPATSWVSNLDLYELSVSAHSIEAQVHLIAMFSTCRPLRDKSVSQLGRFVQEHHGVQGNTARPECITALIARSRVGIIVKILYITWVLWSVRWRWTAKTKKALSLEYQPSPLAALGSVCGPQPSGTAHPLHREKEGEREKAHQQHSNSTSTSTAEK